MFRGLAIVAPQVIVFPIILRDELLNGEIFYSIKELRVLAERWRVHCNTVRQHSSLGYRPPAPAAWLTAEAHRSRI
jgi:transposase InsO family protein